MAEICSELEETASSPCQTPLAPQLNQDSSTSKKKRGPTKCLKTYGLSHENRLPIRLNVHGQPVCRNRPKLSSYLGTLARNFVPLKHTSWHGLKEKQEDIWKTVISKFDIGKRGKKWVLQTTASLWRRYKSQLKKDYNAMKKQGYILKNPPSGVPLEQWKTLVKFWESDLAKEQSKKNRISRAKNTSMHTTGSRTFAEIREEEVMKNPDRREPSWGKMFFITHKPKNGNSLSEGTSRISKLEEAIALHPEASNQSTAQDDIFPQVLGKDRPGLVRIYGRGVMPSNLWGSRSQLETQKLIDVKVSVQVEIQNIQGEMQEKMEAKLQEQVQAIKKEVLSWFNMVLD